MKEYKTVESVQKTVKLVRHACDLCGKESEDENWNARMYYHQTVEVCLSEYMGPEPMGESRSYDICPDCFKSAIVPIFEAKGVNPKIVDW